MNKFEKKSFLIGFFLFFIVQFILVIFINYKEYKLQLHYLDASIKKELELCSYKLNCKNIKIVRRTAKGYTVVKLHKQETIINFFKK